jgi:hypothetical protein
VTGGAFGVGLSPHVREAYRFYRVPTSNTASGLLCMEPA